MVHTAVIMIMKCHETSTVAAVLLDGQLQTSMANQSPQHARSPQLSALLMPLFYLRYPRKDSYPKKKNHLAGLVAASQLLIDCQTLLCSTQKVTSYAHEDKAAFPLQISWVEQHGQRRVGSIIIYCDYTSISNPGTEVSSIYIWWICTIKYTVNSL